MRPDDADLANRKHHRGRARPPRRRADPPCPAGPARLLPDPLAGHRRPPPADRAEDLCRTRRRRRAPDHPGHAQPRRHVEKCRVDRLLSEALSHEADPRRLSLVLGIDE
ncbi:hypothetical protein KPATCC21470_0071 [Kitasatospora purpeofusca]